MFYVFKNHGQKRDKDNPNYGIFEVFFNNRQAAKKVSGEGEDSGPKKGADDVIEKKCAIAHFSNSGNERSESADKRHKTSENDCFPPVFVIEITGFFKILFIKYTRVVF